MGPLDGDLSISGAYDVSGSVVGIFQMVIVNLSSFIWMRKLRLNKVRSHTMRRWGRGGEPNLTVLTDVKAQALSPTPVASQEREKCLEEAVSLRSLVQWTDHIGIMAKKAWYLTQASCTSEQCASGLK